MKKLLLLLITLPLFSAAQDVRSHRPIASLRNESAPDVLLGTNNSPNTSRELVLRDPRLVPQREDCAVANYSFSMTSGSRSWGPVPVNGPKLTDEIKHKIIDWDAANVTITIDNIHLKCNGQETTASPVVLKYDH